MCILVVFCRGGERGGWDMIRYEGAMCGESEDGSRKGRGVGEGKDS